MNRLHAFCGPQVLFTEWREVWHREACGRHIVGRPLDAENRFTLIPLSPPLTYSLFQEIKKIKKKNPGIRLGRRNLEPMRAVLF